MSDGGEFLVQPDPTDPRLTSRVDGVDQAGNAVTTSVTVERPLTLFLNSQEIVTMMTIGDYPEYLAIGYLINQNMLGSEDEIESIDYEEDIDAVIVRTDVETDFEEKLKKKTLTSGCAQGTAFGDLMEKFDEVSLSDAVHIRTSELTALLKKSTLRPVCILRQGRFMAAYCATGIDR